MSVCSLALCLLPETSAELPPLCGARKYVVCADCECPQPAEVAGWKSTPSHHSHCQAVMGNAVPPSPALATLHLLPWSSSYPMSKFGFLAACRPARSPSFTRARSVNDYTEGSGLRDILFKAKHPLGSLPSPAGLHLAFPDPLGLGSQKALLWLPDYNIP